MGGYDTDGTLASPSEDEGFEKKCGICHHWFFEQAKWDKHCAIRNCGCRKHKICFPWTDIYDHALEEEHSRCFVSSCEHKVATEGGWTNDTVIQHIKAYHMDEDDDDDDD